ncbi:hypothetical protein D9M68_954860 [compost metagenome]
MQVSYQVLSEVEHVTPFSGLGNGHGPEFLRATDRRGGRGGKLKFPGTENIGLLTFVGFGVIPEERGGVRFVIQ